MPVAMLSSSLITEPKRYGRFNALDTPQPTKPGMVLVSPTSIDHSGTSATLGENGQVTFNAVTSLSLNGVFSADFDNYVISIRCSASSGVNNNLNARLRASGTDATTNYTAQFLLATSTSVSAGRLTSQTAFFLTNISSAQRNGDYVMLYGPYLAQATAFRNTGIDSGNDATIIDFAATHSTASSYDGITFLPNAINITGALQVYGVRS